MNPLPPVAIDMTMLLWVLAAGIGGVAVGYLLNKGSSSGAPNGSAAVVQPPINPMHVVLNKLLDPPAIADPTADIVHKLIDRRYPPITPPAPPAAK